MGAKSLTPAAKAPEQAGETDWKAVSLSLKEKIDGLGDLLGEHGFQKPEHVTILAFAGEVITSLRESRDLFERQIHELADVITGLDLRGTEDGGACQIAALRIKELAAARAELGKIDAVLLAKDLDPAARSEDMSAVDQLLGLLGDLATTNDQLAGRLGAATAKIETLEEQSAKPTKGKTAGRKPRAKVLALPAEPVKAVDLALNGPTAIVFSEDGGLIDDIKPIEFDPAAFRVVNGRAMLTRRIDIDRDVGFARIDHAWLTVDGKPVSRCEVPGGIVAGGGRGASFAADSLIFA